MVGPKDEIEEVREWLRKAGYDSYDDSPHDSRHERVRILLGMALDRLRGVTGFVREEAENAEN